MKLLKITLSLLLILMLAFTAFACTTPEPLDCSGGTAGSTDSAGGGILGCGGGLGGMLPIILMLVVLVVVMIVPQRRKDKKVKDMLAALKPGDRVRTIGGIYGTIKSMKEDVVTIATGPDQVLLVFARGAISQVEDKGVEQSMDDKVK